MNISLLNNVVIDFQNDVAAQIRSDKGENYDLRVDKSDMNDVLRPIIENTLIGGACVGGRFNTCVNVTRSFNFPKTDLSSKQLVSFANCFRLYFVSMPLELQHSRAYSEVKQLDFLQVRSLPRGSTTTLGELHAREETSQQELLSLKRKQNSSSSSGASGESSSNKTPKKSKKTADESSITTASKSHKSHKHNETPVVIEETVPSTEDKKKKKKKDKK
jgi:hypothetical protein